ncbi:MAG: NfeD family protein [Proteobacteria bacterium]|nr:NfeD family protein [Pseudomonadota bacterium]
MFTIQPWYWLAFGMVLIMFELATPSFTVIWFGCGAILVAGLVWFIPDLTATLQIFFWAIASIFFTVIWFFVIKPKMTDKTKAGIALEAVLGESGLVIRIPHENSRGVIKFTTPLLGAEEWQFICHEAVMPGDRVTVINVSGNTLIVQKK